MQRTAPILLDRAGDALRREGVTVLQTEREFLRHALDNIPLMVRGEMLCQWAEAFYRGRDVPCEEEQSPIKALRDACPLLTFDQARCVLDELGAAYSELCRPIKILDVLESLFPSGPWQEIPSRLHVAQWLLWLDAASIPDYTAPLLQAQSVLWHNDCSSSEKPFYAVHSATEAQACLRKWLGIERGNQIGAYGLFSAPVPTRWLQKATEAWRLEILSREFALFEELRALPLPETLLTAAANVAFEYYVAHAAKLTVKIVNVLEAYLPAQQGHKLCGLCAPPDPGALPAAASEIFAWFREGYLPYRSWQTQNGDEKSQHRVSELAADFARWCLRFYPNAIVGGAGKENLAFHRSARLQATRDGQVTLWFILDGLHYGDAAKMWQIVERESRLTRETNDVVVSSLPTITHFCKKALMYGLPPDKARERDVTPDFPGAIPMSENKDAAQRLSKGQAGDVFIWNIIEPDGTYHKPFDRKTLQANVTEKLGALAEKIVQAALSVPDEFVCRIVISTDHGRLLSAGKRIHDVPDGMTSHGRAAYGSANITFDAAGFVVSEEKNLVYLHGNRFRLDEDCAVTLDDNVFVMNYEKGTNNGKGKTEEFPHGGLYPEEVLIAWTEFVRDFKAPTVRCVVAGQALAGSVGTLRLQIQNPAKVPITVTSLQLNLRDQTARLIPLNATVAALTSHDLVTDIEAWPSRTQSEGATGNLICAMPSGLKFEVAATVEIVSNEMYTPELGRDDLLDLG